MFTKLTIFGKIRKLRRKFMPTLLKNNSFQFFLMAVVLFSNGAAVARAQGMAVAVFVNPIQICEANRLSSNCFQFLMGSPQNEANRFDDEKLHRVTFTQKFEIQTTTVTRAQYFEVMAAAPPAWKAENKCLKNDEIGKISCPNYPAENLSWNDAQAFLEKLNQKESTSACRYRLPTEAEWEYSARGGTTSAYFFGDDLTQLGDHAWFLKNAETHAHEVSKKGANPFGLYDMNGNVWQWVNDWYGEYDLQNTVDPQGPSAGRERVFRGGAWDSDAGTDMRSASRGTGIPNGKVGSTVNRRMGFRLVRTCSSPQS
jgi:formylglycine-generating enzyme required for sulfatase activity